MAESEPFTMTSRSKYFMTFAACFSYFAYSMLLNVTSATSSDLADMTSSSLDSMTTASVVQAISHCVGCIVFGLLFDRTDRQIGLTIMLNACACLTLVIPFVRGLGAFMTIQCLRGLSMSGIEIACIALMIEIWGPQCNMFLQVQQFVFAIAGLSAPYIVQPFVSTIDHVSLNATTKLEIEPADVCSPQQPFTTAIIVPFMLTALIAYLASCCVILMRMPRTRYQRIPSENNLYIISIDNLTSETTPMTKKQVIKKKNWYSIVAIILGCLMLTSYSGMPETASWFLPDFVADVVIGRFSFEDHAGNLMLHIMTGMSCITNAVTILVTIYISPKKLAFFNLIVIAVANLMLLSFARISLIMTWLSVIMMGIGFGNMIGSMYAFLSEKILLTNTVVGLLVLSTKLPIILNWIAFSSVYRGNAMTFVYLNILAVTICSTCFAILCLNNTWLRRRTRPRKPDV